MLSFLENKRDHNFKGKIVISAQVLKSLSFTRNFFYGVRLGISYQRILAYRWRSFEEVTVDEPVVQAVSDE